MSHELIDIRTFQSTQEPFWSAQPYLQGTSEDLTDSSLTYWRPGVHMYDLLHDNSALTYIGLSGMQKRK